MTGAVESRDRQHGRTAALDVLLAATSFETAGDINSAIKAYRNSVELINDDPEILVFAAEGLRRLGRLIPSIQLFDRALAITPDAVAALYGKALACEANGQFAEACACFERVTTLAPQTPHGYAGAASTMIALNRTGEAKGWADRALAIDDRNFGAHFALARCAMDTGRFDEAEKLLTDLVADLHLAPDDRVRSLSLLGRARESLNDHSGAYAAWEEANRVFVAHSPRPAGDTARERIDALSDRLASLTPLSVPRLPKSTRQHIFVIGFPRSGSTLIEQILRSVPGVATTEEEPTLVEAADRYLTPRGLENLTVM